MNMACSFTGGGRTQPAQGSRFDANLKSYAAVPEAFDAGPYST